MITIIIAIQINILNSTLYAIFWFTIQNRLIKENQKRK